MTRALLDALPPTLDRPSGRLDRSASSTADGLLSAVSFALLCLWTGSSPAALPRRIAAEGFDLSDARP